MTTPWFSAQSPAYTLEEGLREQTPVSSVRRGAPDEWAREELLLRKLGAKGWGRVYHFRNFYGSGWGGTGRVLSPRALDAFFRFLEAASFPPGSSPSVFLTERGGLELCWEDRSSHSVQVEFTASGVEFYQGATESEGTVSFEDLPQLSRRLAA